MIQGNGLFAGAGKLPGVSIWFLQPDCATLAITQAHSATPAITSYHRPSPKRAAKIFLLEHVNPGYVTACVSRHSPKAPTG